MLPRSCSYPESFLLLVLTLSDASVLYCFYSDMLQYFIQFSHTAENCAQALWLVKGVNLLAVQNLQGQWAHPHKCVLVI